MCISKSNQHITTKVNIYSGTFNSWGASLNGIVLFFILQNLCVKPTYDDDSTLTGKRERDTDV